MPQIGWSHLNSRFGNLGRNASIDNIRRAVQEMYHEDHADLLESDYAEHPDAWINYGFDDGPMYTLAIRRFGGMLLEKRIDQDDVDHIEFFRMDNVVEEHCCRICTSLVEGDLESVLRAPWTKTET